ncbi:MAG: MCE family protein [Actinomycetota bacterium]|nr:MCE family protein [Actinomycetota bacterium]
MQRFIRPLAGLVIVLLVLGGAGLALRGGDNTYEVTAYFEKAIGLFPNSDVDILGVPVGKVTSVDPQGSSVKVVMQVSDEYKVPADAFAQIVPISVIADRFIQLHPPYTGSGPTLEDGAVLDLDRTQIPAELDDVFKQLKKLLEAIEPGEEGEPGALGSLIVELNKTLRDREQDLKGTIVNTSALTGALADAQNDLSQTLINLNDFFGTLATQAGSIGSLNANLATVMGTLAESRDDLEQTLANLADMTGEVGRVVELHGDRLGGDLQLAANILSTILKNRQSVEESLSWLPVVAIGLKNAYHGGEIKATDVRDSLNDLSCTPLEDLPNGPVKDALREICRDFTTEPPPETATGDESEATIVPERDEPLDCRDGVRKVRRQLKRLRAVELPAAVLDQAIAPLERKLRRLARECKKFGEELTGRGGILGDGGLLDSITDDLGTVPDLGSDEPDVAGVAAGPGAVGETSPSAFDSFTDWLSGLTSFLGWSW